MAALVTDENVSLCYIKIISRYKNAAAIIRDPYLPPTVDGAPLVINQFASTGLWKKSDLTGE